MQHQNDQLRLVEAYGCPNLIENKFAVVFAFGRSQALGAAGDFDLVHVENAAPLQIFAEAEVETVIEAPDHGRIALVILTRRVEMIHLLHHHYFAGAMMELHT